MESISRVDILGIPFCSMGYSEVLKQIHCWHDAQKCGVISFVNPHSVVTARKDKEMDAALRHSSLILPDGVGICLASRILGYPPVARITGPSLMLKLCEWSQYYGYSHFFYGGAAGVSERLAERLKQKIPKIKIAGTYCPPFRVLHPQEETVIVEHINSCKPDIVWIGLGAPKQEKWIHRHLGRIRATALIGVGAAFDFHSGQKKWAPRWVRELGIEWAFRLLQEPERMWRRNLNSFVFLGLVLGQKMKLLFGKSQRMLNGGVSAEDSVALYDWPVDSVSPDKNAEQEPVLYSRDEIV